jgi:murein L,D-transpeptidase YafK
VALAALSAAIALSGCDTDNIAPNGRAQAPLSERTLAELEQKQMDKGSPILMRIFKEEAEAEIWKKNRDGEYALLKTYPICRWSGDLGPKKKEGDRQAPEGFYAITPGQMNPNSHYYLAFNMGYPNAYDRSWGRTGSELMVHGDCSSRGCYAMTDEQMVEIYALAREAFFGGQRSFQVQAYPFRMTPKNMARHRNSPHMAFWKMLKVGYDHFEVTHQEPKVDVCERHYVFDAQTPANATRPISFSPAGKCPAYEVQPEIAQLVKEKEQKDAAEYASLVPFTQVAASRAGIDGGMNPVYLSQFNPPAAGENGNRAPIVATMATPGALPRSPNNPPAQTVPPAAATVQLASATPEPAAPAASPASDANGKPGSIGNFLGGLFGRDEPAAAIANPPTPTAAPKRATAVAHAKPAHAPTMRTASAPAKPAAKVASATPMPELRPQIGDKQADKPAAKQATKPAAAPQTRKPAEPDLRTAYNSSPRASTGSGLLSGAQPVVPAGNFGSFESRWSGLR